MAKGNNQKLKLLYMAKLFAEKTDEVHGLTVQDFIRLLKDYGINADRKTLYLDFEELRHFGMDIVKANNGRNVYYFLASRDFELPELKLLVDTVQSAKFITESKSRELITKLETLASVHEARQLQRQVIISGRVKTINESIYYSVDQIHTAINHDVQIDFQYFQWNVKKEMELRHDGAWYHISPWALVWDDEYYYLIGYDPEGRKIKHYRVDKMLHIAVTDRRRDGREVFEAINLPKYSNGLFGMYGGEQTNVTLLCENSMAGTIIDRFGTDIAIVPSGPEHFITHVQVSASRQFLGWVIALGPGVRITAPETMVSAMRDEARRLAEQYRI
jgi:predicted DNA-binding transcriptional regulator YafY